MITEDRILQIQQRLQALHPTHLEVIDESHKHIGHPGAQSGGGHFLVIIASEKFKGQSLIACHRMIYDALDDLMEKEIHALKIKIASMQ